MGYRNILQGKKAYDEILIGIDKVADVVGSTMGAGGTTVMLSQGHGTFPIVTKDGITCAANIVLEGEYENVGAMFLRNAGDRTVTEAGDGPQPLYSKVLTPNGFVNMGDIKIGDDICGTNGTIQKVLGVFPKGEKEIYRVRFFDNRVVECCKDHLWSVITNYGTNKTLTVGSLLDNGGVTSKTINGGDSCKYYTPTTYVDFNDNGERPIDAYLLGLLLGDGSLSGSGSIELSLGKNKEHVIGKIILPEGFNLNIKWVESKNSFRVKINGLSKDGLTIHKVIESIGLLGCVSSSKFIPKSYLYSPKNVREALLQGLLDTDGYINEKGLFEISTISEQLCKDILELSRGLGLSIGFRKLIRTPGSSYSMTPIYRIQQRLGYKYGTKLINIEATGVYTEMQCIKVSNPDNLYITDDYIVTHNTTQTIVLARHMIKEGIKQVSVGFRPHFIKSGIEKAVNAIVEEIKANAEEIEADSEKLKNIATISANNDIELGTLISDAYAKIGKGGLLNIENSTTVDTYIKVVDGFEFDRGYMHGIFKNNEKHQAVYENPLILVAQQDIKQLKDVAEICRPMMEQGRPLIIIASSIEGECFSSLVATRAQKSIPIVCIKAPNTYQKELLSDISVLTGATLISEERGLKIGNAKVSHLGECDKIIVTPNSTTIIGGKGDKVVIKDREDEVKNLLNETTDKAVKEVHKKRLARLTSSIGVIYVGASTDVEAREKMDRVDDSVKASKSALEEGICAGGGVTLLRCAKVLDSVICDNDDEKAGVYIIRKALEVPIRQILKNAGADESYIVREVIERGGDNGYNVKTMQFEDLRKAGVVDPCKVIRVALQNSSSVACAIITSNNLVVDMKPKS